MGWASRGENENDDDDDDDDADDDDGDGGGEDKEAQVDDDPDGEDGDDCNHEDAAWFGGDWVVPSAVDTRAIDVVRSDLSFVAERMFLGLVVGVKASNNNMMMTTVRVTAIMLILMEMVTASRFSDVVSVQPGHMTPTRAFHAEFLTGAMSMVEAELQVTAQRSAETQAAEHRCFESSPKYDALDATLPGDAALAAAAAATEAEAESPQAQLRDALGESIDWIRELRTAMGVPEVVVMQHKNLFEHHNFPFSPPQPPIRTRSMVPLLQNEEKHSKMANGMSNEEDQRISGHDAGLMRIPLTAVKSDCHSHGILCAHKKQDGLEQNMYTGRTTAWIHDYLTAWMSTRLSTIIAFIHTAGADSYVDKSKACDSSENAAWILYEGDVDRAIQADDALAPAASDAAPAEVHRGIVLMAEAEEAAPIAAEAAAPAEVQEPPAADEGAVDAAPAEAPAVEEPPADPAAPAEEAGQRGNVPCARTGVQAAPDPPPTSEAEPKTAEVAPAEGAREVP
ncbi:hypothetical protein AK812_SmicGene26979 [Symbiodinium microadriaticum]|uniref:Uncharacterized protein n=1 Tax=Symbiodinium microadriaticum TaxID=2951 RepID=A0A1Q9D837_SYMMI|nr:hypothetical protein AK812_SmicGene26979 [Symbiodinium microadriaticum]